MLICLWDRFRQLIFVLWSLNRNNFKILHNTCIFPAADYSWLWNLHSSISTMIITWLFPYFSATEGHPAHTKPESPLLGIYPKLWRATTMLGISLLPLPTQTLQLPSKSKSAKQTHFACIDCKQTRFHFFFFTNQTSRGMEHGGFHRIH